MSRPCVFFDRDGIVNEPPVAARYVRSKDEFRLIPEFADVLRLVTERGYAAIVVTNQKGVATGVMTRRAVDEIHEILRDRLGESGLSLLDILVCTAASDDDPRRKPNPGMLVEAAERHGLDLKQSWMVGDNEKDVEAGRRAGCRAILVSAAAQSTKADYHVPDMKGLLQLLEKVLPRFPGFDPHRAEC